MTITKRPVLWTIITALLLATSIDPPSAGAQGPAPGKPSKSAWGDGLVLGIPLGAMNLTPEQDKRVSETLSAYRGASAAVIRQLRQAQSALADKLFALGQLEAVDLQPELQQITRSGPSFWSRAPRPWSILATPSPQRRSPRALGACPARATALGDAPASRARQAVSLRRRAAVSLRACLRRPKAGGERSLITTSTRRKGMTIRIAVVAAIAVSIAGGEAAGEAHRAAPAESPATAPTRRRQGNPQ